MAAEAEQGFHPLDEASLVAYIKATPALASRLGGGGGLDSLEIKEVGDGNLNFVYIVKSSSGAIVVKQVRFLSSARTARPDPDTIIASITRPNAGAPVRAPRRGLVADVAGASLLRGLHAAGAWPPVPGAHPRGLPLRPRHVAHGDALHRATAHHPPQGPRRRRRVPAARRPHVRLHGQDSLLFTSLLFNNTTDHKKGVAQYCANVEMARLTEQVVFSDPYRTSKFNWWTSPYLDKDAEAVRQDDELKLEAAELKSVFVERAQALIHGDLHTGSIMVTPGSTQVIDPEFGFYGPMGYDVGAFLGNLILAYYAQNGHADHANDRKAYKKWILKAIEESWNLFQKKFVDLWNIHKEGNGEAYLPDIYNSPDLLSLAQKKYMTNLFHDSLGFGSAKMIRRIVGIAHVEDLESIKDASKRAECERAALNCAKTLLKGRRRFVTIEQVIEHIQSFDWE